jgi:hypothetical protein
MSARHAAALASAITADVDLFIRPWLESPMDQRENLHDVDPFSYLDPRTFFYVGENPAWVAQAEDRGKAVVAMLRSGRVPHEVEEACFWDELIVLATIPAARAILADEPYAFTDLADDADDPDAEEEAWDAIEDWMSDGCRFPVDGAIGPRNRLFRYAIYGNDPRTWFDPLSHLPQS